MDESLRQRFVRRVTQLDLPGAAAALVTPDATAVLTAGDEEVGCNRPVASDTRFCLASCSKAFTAVGLATLVEQGALRFDDPVVRHLPELLLDSEELTQRATLRDLLGMRLGLEAQGAAAWGRSRHVPHTAMLRRMRHLPRKMPLGEGFIYSNLSYTAIADVIARVSGTRFSDYMKGLCRRLGLTRSFVEEGPMEVQPGIAVPHARLEGGWTSLGGNRCGGREGESCQYSSATEMGEWLRFHLEGGVAQGQQVLASKMVNELHCVQTLVPGSAASGSSGYCMGWMRGELYGSPILAHEGG